MGEEGTRIETGSEYKWYASIHSMEQQTLRMAIRCLRFARGGTPGTADRGSDL